MISTFTWRKRRSKSTEWDEVRDRTDLVGHHNELIALFDSPALELADDDRTEILVLLRYGHDHWAVDLAIDERDCVKLGKE